MAFETCTIICQICLLKEKAFLFNLVLLCFLFARVHIHHPGQAAMGGPQCRGGAMHGGRRQHLPD